MAVGYTGGLVPSGRPGFLIEGVQFLDHFVGTSLSATDDAATWDSLMDSGSTAVIAEDEPNGVVTLTPNEIGLDATIFLNGEPIAFDRSKDAIFETRLKVSSIATNTLNWFVGLADDAPNFDLASGTAGGIEKNLIGFNAQGDASIDAIVGNGTSETIDDTTDDLVADTYVVLTWKWHAKSRTLRYYVDGVRRVTQSVDDGDLIPADATQMTIIIFAEQNAGSSTVDLDVDYVAFAQSA